LVRDSRLIQLVPARLVLYCTTKLLLNMPSRFSTGYPAHNCNTKRCLRLHHSRLLPPSPAAGAGSYAARPSCRSPVDWVFLTPIPPNKRLLRAGVSCFWTINRAGLPVCSILTPSSHRPQLLQSRVWHGAAQREGCLIIGQPWCQPTPWANTQSRSRWCH